MPAPCHIHLNSAVLAYYNPKPNVGLILCRIVHQGHLCPRVMKSSADGQGCSIYNIHPSQRKTLFYSKDFMGSDQKWLWICMAPTAELTSIFVRLPLAAPISGGTRPHCGYSDWSGVGHDQGLQADDHVVASFGDDLPNILAVLLQLLLVPPLGLLAGAGSSSGSQCSARTARCTSCALRAPTPLAAWSSGSSCYRRMAASLSPSVRARPPAVQEATCRLASEPVMMLWPLWQRSGRGDANP